MSGRLARRAACGAAVLWLSGLLVACGGGDDSPPDTSDDPQTRVVTGFVGNASTGRGIPNAEVRLGADLARTNVRGEFRAEDIPLSDLSVRVSAVNFVERLLTLSASQSTLDVRLSPTTTDGDGFELPPGSPAL